MTAARCPNPACAARREAGHYLCRDCWDALPAAARRQLRRRDRLAARRLQQLLGQLADGLPPHSVTITQ